MCGINSSFAVQDPLIYQIGLALKAALETDESSDRLYAESAATFLAVHILRHYSTRTQKIQDYVGGMPQHKLKQAIEYIQEHLSENISLETIANHIEISSYHFCRLFKQSTGFSPHQYVIHQRVERAKQLLRQGKMSIWRNCDRCGFSHQSHFEPTLQTLDWRNSQKLDRVIARTCKKSKNLQDFSAAATYSQSMSLKY
ncbi:MAG: helix-turn-helix transcriptional regulator [Microcoleus sp. SM1_3_4]|nr:helix-turn-helix transcriptional regulator [Microcoleus sp. SM1_3_4]